MSWLVLIFSIIGLIVCNFFLVYSGHDFGGQVIAPGKALLFFLGEVVCLSFFVFGLMDLLVLGGLFG